MLVSAPFVHVLICSLFLMGYCFAFGGGVAQFLSITDIFSISISDISILYLMLFSGLAFSVLARAKLGAWTKAEALIKQERHSDQTKEWEKLNKQRKYVFSLVTSIGFGLLVGCILYYLYKGRINYGAAGGAAILLTVRGLGPLLNMFDFHGARFIAPLYIALAIIMPVTWGMQKGDLDRYKSYNELVDEAPVCGKFALIRPFSPLFLAIGNNNRHYMIDSNCVGKFRLKGVPAPKSKINFSS